MIIGEAKAAATAAGHPRDTIDGLFRRAGVRHADIIALADPPDRDTVDGVAARWFTYAEADHAVSAIAATLRQLDLPVDTIVAYQLPNTVENVLTLLGILRAGMIAAPLPLLWRKADIVGALAPIGAKVLIASGRVGAYASVETAMQAAAELFPIRYLCSFGTGLSDGIVPLDPLLTQAPPATVPAIPRQGDPSAHIAVITWEVTANGTIPVARSHSELLAGAPALTEMDAANVSFLSATPPTSFAGLALTLAPWLIRGGTLHLHHGFDAEIFAAQAAERHCDVVVAPGPVVALLAETGFFVLPDIAQVIALWRTPESLAGAEPWTERPPLTDAVCFGEIGLLSSTRTRGARPAPKSTGSLKLSHTEDGILALRGPMVPAADFPPGPPREGLLQLDRRAAGEVATGYRCRLDPRDASVTITAPPAGIVGIGGYRLARSEIDTTASLFGGDTGVAILPNRLTGQRLAGTSEDRATVHALLTEQGCHALLAGAFAPPRSAAA